MVTSPSPWSVKGVDPEAREAAKIAARKSGMTVGAWLSQMIRQSAAEQLRNHGSQRPRQPSSEAPAADGFGYPPGYQGYPPQYAAQYPPQPPPGMSPPPAPTIQAVFESIQRLSSRIEQSEQRTAETIAPIVDKVAELSRKIDETKDGEATSTAPVERAMQKIAERLDKIEDGGAARPRPVAPVREPERGGFFRIFRRD